MKPKETEVLAKDRDEGEAGSSAADTASALPKGAGEQDQAATADGVRSATGILLQTGQALYRPGDKDSMTPYAEIRTDVGKVERLWGVTMPGAIREAQAKNGDRVSIILDGKETVDKMVTVTDEKTGAKTRELRSVERNHWIVTVHRPEEDKNLPTPEQQQTEEKAPVESMQTKPASASKLKQGRFQLDRQEAERFTGKAWAEMNPLEKARESSRQKEAARDANGAPTPFQFNDVEAERYSGRPVSSMNAFEYAMEHSRQKAEHKETQSSRHEDNEDEGESE
ncbi:hypothetical protein [Brucella intermedia]|uniref:hypothetical protein n=1 Tax=Brucella intermedia TaxID=94625 RepID=UPI00124F5E8D|nr:hypothetical protein [Brucella intermedia]KAB2722410.1 hypothetical protein F9L02_22785 [Brucella intermedia]